MKNYFIILSLIIFINSCKEDGPFIDFSPTRVKLQGDTEYVAAVLAVPQKRNVLLEDITGVKCPNCPAAHDVAKAINDANPGRIVITALHTFSNDFFTNPNPPSQGWPDFRPQDSSADYIVTKLLDNPTNLPQGVINRKKFPAEAYRYFSYSKWAGYINQELVLPDSINLEISNSYNPTSRELTVVIKMECTDSIPHDVYLSVGITESKIIGKQLSGTAYITNYEHNHIFRKMLTTLSGLKINSSTVVLDARKVVVRVFKYSLPAGWNESNCSVIGILHNNASVIDVIQCAEKKIL